MNYKLLKSGSVLRVDDGATIPPTTDNLDWVRYQAWLAAGNAPLPADPVVASPDVNGFLTGLKALFGGAVALNTVARAYPTFVPDLLSANWPDLQAIILDAQAKAAITPAQYASIKALATQFSIPVTLP